MKKQLFWIAILILGLCTSAAFAQNTIKIGLMAPLTGQYASEGQEMKQVVDLLAANVNAKGGVLGKKIELITQDDGSDPRTAALAAQKLVSQGVVAAIGTYGSSVTEPTQNIFNESGIVQIANGATAIRLTEKKLNTFFRTCPRDDAQAEVVAAALKKYGYKKIAILHDNQTYSKDLADETQKLLAKEAGVKVVFFDALTPKQQDYSTILTKLKQANPDVVLYTGYYPEAGLLLRQKKEMGWNVPFMGGDATGNPDLVKVAGADAAAGFYFVNAPLPVDVPEAKGFVNEFKAKYGAPPASIYSVLAGDGFEVIVAALNGTKGNAKQLAQYMHTHKDFPGLTGKISFNAQGDRVGAVYRVYKVDAKGNFVIQP